MTIATLVQELVTHPEREAFNEPIRSNDCQMRIHNTKPDQLAQQRQSVVFSGLGSQLQLTWSVSGMHEPIHVRGFPLPA